ncbi:MAG TPA: S1 RNA-binding domain-containing protein, partial [Candidatus Izemoplasmatales bacterium]|nr:S1 RNA-binding domain-containing protein [Candidatus Izemoplasmatales bacterium]
MKLGDFNTLTVLRETDIAYQLTDGENEFFLHKKEALRNYLKGEVIEVFLYVDNQGRPTASTR